MISKISARISLMQRFEIINFDIRFLVSHISFRSNNKYFRKYQMDIRGLFGLLISR